MIVQKQAKKNKQNDKIYILSGRKIKECRTALNLTQTELAERCNMKPGYISMLESGKRGGSDDFLLSLETLLELKPNTLISLREKDLQERENKTEEIEITSIQIEESGSHEEVEVQSNTDKLPKVEARPEQEVVVPTKNKKDKMDVSEILAAFSNRLLSFDEEYTIRKIEQYMKDLDSDYANQLPSIDLEGVMTFISDMKNRWMKQEQSMSLESFKGLIGTGKKKSYLSLEENTLGLEIVMQTNQHETETRILELIGLCSVQFNLPNNSSICRENTVCFIWFSPFVTLSKMFEHLQTKQVELSSMQMNDPRLAWYLKEQFSTKLIVG